MEGKAERLPFVENEKQTKWFGKLIHSNLCCSIDPDRVDGSLYFYTIIDDYSHFTVVKTLVTKNEAEKNLLSTFNS